MYDKLAKSRLNDYYGGLLNKHQSEILRMYYDCDMSLSEISDVFGITRQGAREVIARSEKKLAEYDSQLKLISKVDGLAKRLSDIIEEMSDENAKQKLAELLQSIKEL